jgi:hypothetical protein
MNERANPFANLKDEPAFAPKPRAEKPVAPEALAEVAEQNNFTSRQPVKAAKAQTRKPRRHRTGRNQQFNAKATAETITRIYKQADDLGVVLGEWMRLAADALDKSPELKKTSNPATE